MLDTAYPFRREQPGYLRFLTLGDGYFEVLVWSIAPTSRPAMPALVDIGSRDASSLALVGTGEGRH
ncbi:hypothetical protein OG992_33155 [Micromonospora sp. NBC_00362]|uniref:hypothetical protein n=1 Tax=Micromonospora sp. NBC_00362 TaxID=2975975 RepID=UPI002253BB82|nr:hypothetical protein [Micromonospora sp. NBC_00362]MCX5122014.1 hypothetical protein [Micromonospora sp. NBC_00362]